MRLLQGFDAKPLGISRGNGVERESDDGASGHIASAGAGTNANANTTI
ncbi:MAG: hypothetical protein R3C09_20260 [Pirellulaceae bacterium]